MQPSSFKAFFLATIPCLVRKFIVNEYAVFIPISIQSPRITGHILALLDTGSPFTVISPRDLERFRISLKTLANTPAPTVSLAGFKFKRHSLGSATIHLRDKDDAVVSFQTECFNMIGPTKIDKKTSKELQAIPSLIGNDFLREIRATFVFNPSDKVAFLEIP